MVPSETPADAEPIASKRELFRLAMRERHDPDPYYRKLAVRTVAELPFDVAGKRVLDLGCGQGFDAAALRDAGALVTAMDLDVSLAGETQGRGVRALAADALRAPFADATFDIVYCSNIVEHVPSVSRLFDEIARLLVPGARPGCRGPTGSRRGVDTTSFPSISSVLGWGRGYTNGSGVGRPRTCPAKDCSPPMSAPRCGSSTITWAWNWSTPHRGTTPLSVGFSGCRACASWPPGTVCLWFGDSSRTSERDRQRTRRRIGIGTGSVEGPNRMDDSGGHGDDEVAPEP